MTSADPPPAFARQHASDVLRFSLRQHGPGFPLGPHFRLVELASRDGADEVLVHPSLIVLLNTVRRTVDRPVHVTSGYRTAAHNREIGGTIGSRHVLGLAADVQARGIAPAEIAALAERLGVGGIGDYPTFTHLDVDGAGRRWPPQLLYA